MTVTRSVEPAIAHNAPRSRPEEGHPQRPPVVFVLEDDRPTLELLCGVAEDAGWQPRGFERVRELRDALARTRPNLLILDDSVPDGRGGDLAREIRTDPETQHLPVVVCTAAHPARRAEIGDWAPVVPKPFAVEQIERFLDTVARRRDRYHRPAG